MRGTLKKHKDRWRAHVYVGRDSAGKQVRKSKVFDFDHSNTGRHAAEAAMRDWIVELESSKGFEKPGRTISDMLEAWYQVSEPGWSVKHRAATRRQIDIKIVPRIGHLDMTRVGQADLENFYAKLLIEGGEDGGTLSPGSVKHAHIALRAAFRRAKAWGWINADPTEFLSPPKGRRTQITPPTLEQIEAAAAATTDPMWAAYLRLAWTTGARRSQILGLKWSDLTPQQATFRRGVTAANGQVEVKGTKADRPYTVTLDGRTVDVVDVWRFAQKELALDLGADLDGDAYVFSIPPGGEPIHPDSVTNWWRKLRGLVPVLTGVRLHDLRHFAASYLLSQGEPVLSVAHRLGHADATTTLRVYGHFVPGSDHSAADIMGKLG